MGTAGGVVVVTITSIPRKSRRSLDLFLPLPIFRFVFLFSKEDFMMRRGHDALWNLQMTILETGPAYLAPDMHTTAFGTVRDRTRKKNPLTKRGFHLPFSGQSGPCRLCCCCSCHAEPSTSTLAYETKLPKPNQRERPQTTATFCFKLNASDDPSQ